jgi:hypothetical protein
LDRRSVQRSASPLPARRPSRQASPYSPRQVPFKFAPSPQFTGDARRETCAILSPCRRRSKRPPVFQFSWPSPS